MKVLFDTSVIIAASLSHHPNDTSCFVQIQAVKAAQIKGYLSAHSIESHLQYLETVALEQADYQAAIAQMTILSLPGGGIFDALIAQAALKSATERLLTLNPKHFTRLSTAIAQMVYVLE